jgi:ABC-2 type transport system ATP-binding protein
MADIEETCSRLVILDAGAVLFDGALDDLHRRLSGRRAIELHLEPGSRGLPPDLQRELDVFGATLIRTGALSLTFEVPAEHARPFIQRLFDLFVVRDLAVERQPLEHLVREIFVSGAVKAAS